MSYEEIKALKQDILASLHCALPGTVVSFDAETQTAVIQPAVCRSRRNVGDSLLVPRAWNGESRPLVPPLLRSPPQHIPRRSSSRTWRGCRSWI